MQNTKTAFVGRITTSADARNAAFRVKLYVDSMTLLIVSAEGDEWSWNLDDVTFSRASVDRFHLQLAEEELYFLPVDTLGFIANVVNRHSGTPLEPHRGWLRRRIEAAQAEGGEISGYDLEIEDEPATDSQDSSRRRHVHEWAEGSAVGVRTRRCVKCGKVSIDATGLKSTLEVALLGA